MSEFRRRLMSADKEEPLKSEVLIAQQQESGGSAKITVTKTADTDYLYCCGMFGLIGLGYTQVATVFNNKSLDADFRDTYGSSRCYVNYKASNRTFTYYSVIGGSNSSRCVIIVSNKAMNIYCTEYGSPSYTRTTDLSNCQIAYLFFGAVGSNTYKLITIDKTTDLSGSALTGCTYSYSISTQELTYYWNGATSNNGCVCLIYG